jgi:hypothetical protein
MGERGRMKSSAPGFVCAFKIHGKKWRGKL